MTTQAPETNTPDLTDEKSSSILHDIDDSKVVDVENSSGSLNALQALSPEERLRVEKEIKWKMDSRLMPTILLIFILNYIDRSAVTAARLKGLEKDLNLTTLEYSNVLAILYVSYCLLQPATTMIINKVQRPSYFIAACIVGWGVCSACTGLVHNYAGIMAARFFLGAPEACFYPGAAFLFSRWYTRKELALRTAVLAAGVLISNAFGSLVAAGILANLDGARGIRAWRWLFYIEGAITILFGFLSLLALPDYPHNTRWMTPIQTAVAQARLSEDAAEADEDLVTDTAFTGLKLALLDPKVYFFATLNFAQLMGNSYVNFFPSLVATLGYSSTKTLLVAAPPWVVGTIVTLANARHADKTGERTLHSVIPYCASMLGIIIALSTMNTAARYVSLFFLTSGYAGFALTLVWVSNAIPRPPAKRAAAVGIVNGFGNLGVLAGSYFWKANWAPKYRNSFIIALCGFVTASLCAFVIRTILARQNRAMDKTEAAELADPNVMARVQDAARLEGITVKEAILRRRRFRYLL